jgi:hypothetical protein
MDRTGIKMDWTKKYSAENEPSFEDIAEFIGSPLWDEINSYIHQAYKLQPKLAYSKCSAQPGWNVKYQKGGRSLCTLYPMSGYFIALVVIGEKETHEAELLMPSLSTYIQQLYANTSFSCGGRWLMIEIKSREILADTKELINLRVKPK